MLGFNSVDNSVNYLVIGYGNTLRSDDGAGYRVAEIAETWDIPNLRSLPIHQLTPELAEAIAQSHLTFFVDVWLLQSNETPELRVEAIAPDTTATYSGHACDPRALLALAQMLYGKAPRAYWVLIPAESFAFGEELSAIAQKGLEEALEKIKKMLS